MTSLLDRLESATFLPLAFRDRIPSQCLDARTVYRIGVAAIAVTSWLLGMPFSVCVVGSYLLSPTVGVVGLIGSVAGTALSQFVSFWINRSLEMLGYYVINASLTGVLASSLNDGLSGQRRLPFQEFSLENILIPHIQRAIDYCQNLWLHTAHD